MTSFDSFKTQIFPGVNDTPEEATADRASNGSSLINKVNGLCDTLNTLSEPTQNWEQYTPFFLDVVDGNDNNSGLEDGQAKKTVKGLVNLIATKRIFNSITIYIVGEINDTLDFSKLRRAADSKYDLPEINIFAKFNRVYSIKHGREIAITNSDSGLSIAFNSCNFTAVDKSLKLKNLRGKISFVGCNFTAAANTQESVLSIEDCSLVKIQNYDSTTFSKGDSNCNVGLCCFNNSNVYLDGGSFSDFFTALEVYGFSTVVNEGNPIVFNNCQSLASVYRKGTLLTRNPEVLVDNVDVYDSGVFNDIATERFFLNQITDTTVELFINDFDVKKIYYFEVNFLPANTTLELFVDNTTTNLILDNENTFAQSNLPEFPFLFPGQLLKIAIAGTIPNNTIISITMIEVGSGLSSFVLPPRGSSPGI